MHFIIDIFNQGEINTYKLGVNVLHTYYMPVKI